MRLTNEQKTQLYDVLDATENSVILYAIADYILSAESAQGAIESEIDALIREMRQTVLDCAERVKCCEKIFREKLNE